MTSGESRPEFVIRGGDGRNDGHVDRRPDIRRCARGVTA